MKIHHIGYLVDEIQEAAKEFERLGFCRSGEIAKDLSRGVYILFLNHTGQAIELIQPIDNKSPVYGLRKKYRNSPYHICYETSDLRTAIGNMVKNSGGGVYVDPTISIRSGYNWLSQCSVFDESVYRDG